MRAPLKTQLKFRNDEKLKKQKSWHGENPPVMKQINFVTSVHSVTFQ